MAKRPALKVGDVVRLSKKGLRIHRHQRARFDTMVVHAVSGDGSDGMSKIVCTYFERSKAHRASFKRRELWSTGFNAISGNQPKVTGGLTSGSQNYADPRTGKATSAVVKPTQTNDGRTHCMSCARPTVFIPGFGSGGYNICKNKSCRMYDT